MMILSRTVSDQAYKLYIKLVTHIKTKSVIFLFYVSFTHWIRCVFGGSKMEILIKQINEHVTFV